MKLLKGISYLVHVIYLVAVIPHANMYPQEKEILDSRGSKVPSELLIPISVSLNQVSFSEAIQEVARKGNFHLNYNENIIPVNNKVTFTTENKPAFLVLKELLKGTNISIIVINVRQLVLIKLSEATKVDSQSKFTVSGYVTNSESGEALIGANIYNNEYAVGAATNSYGYYSITLPAETYIFRYSYIGYESKEVFVDLNADKKISISLAGSSVTSDTVLVVSKVESENVTSTRMGTFKLQPASTNNIPVFLGEQDILKTIQMLPGISNYREVDCGIYVRGGNADQNLILLDEAPIYNAFHTFGFFSIFNSDAIKNISLIKGSAPAKFGGRLSSVVDMQMNEGNMKKFNGVAGLGLIFSRLTLQGPLVEDKASYLISARRTYFDLFTRLASGGDFKFHLYDLNAKVNYKIDDDDRVYVSGYFGRDGFGSGDEFNMDWGNTTTTIRWNHLFSNKLFLNSSFIFSNFKYETSINDNDESNDMFNYLSEVNNITFKEDFEYFADSKNNFGFGASYIHHSFLPAQMSLRGDFNYRFTIGKKSANELNGYFSHEYNWNRRLKLEYGLRGTLFFVDGESDSYNFEEIVDLNVDFHDSASNAFGGFEPRFTLTYLLNDSSSVKLGLSRNYQYLHQISNSVSGTPLDVWQPSSSKAKPQRADQISIGYFKNFSGNNYEFSIETYYKDLRNQVDYKDGANFILKNFFESELVIGRGWAYGAELFLKKNLGDLTGWISYSISKSKRQFDEVDGGRAFNAANDKTHELSLVAQYQLSSKWVLSANMVYASGFNITIPYGTYYIDGKKYLAYTDRNGYRLPSYQRLDLGFSYTNDLGGTWSVSLYNVFNRKNIYTVLFNDKADFPGKMEAIKLSLFGMIPSLTYTLRF